MFTSIDWIASYSSYDHVDLIAPRPLLMIAGSRADTLYFSEQTCAKAGPTAELYLIHGATRIDLYDKPTFVGQAMDRFARFFKNHL